MLETSTPLVAARLTMAHHFALVRGAATRKMCDAYEWQRHADDGDDDDGDNGGADELADDGDGW